MKNKYPIKTKRFDPENLTREIMENIPDHIYFKDLNSKFVTVNTAFCNWTRLEKEAILGKTDFDLFQVAHAQKAFENEQSIIKSGLPLIGIEEKEIWADGRVTWVSTSKMPWKNKAGTIVGTFGISRDITEKKNLESQLIQAQKLESVGQLAAGIAHEINTPIQFVSDNLHFLKNAAGDLMTLIEKYSELIEQAGVSEKQIQAHTLVLEDTDAEYLHEEIPAAIEQAIEGTQRVANIVRAIKEFSHPGRMEMTHSNLNEAIRATIAVAKNEWKYVADIETRLDESLPMVPCRISEINQVILNMIVNARDAIEETGANGTITLSTTHRAQAAIITISDTGAGIPDEIRKRIFDPFFTTKEVGKGSGQGLAIAHNVIVKKHRGMLNLSSKPGQGTTFEIVLPLQHQNQELAMAS